MTAMYTLPYISPAQAPGKLRDQEADLLHKSDVPAYAPPVFWPSYTSQPRV